jgi:hypothetical protein
MLAKNVVCPWLPQKAVKLGESWNYEEEVETESMGKAVVSYRYTLEKYDAITGHAELAFKGWLNADTAELPPGLNLDYLRAQGTSIVDVKHGRLLSSELEQQIAMIVVVRPEDREFIEITTRLSQQSVMRLMRAVQEMGSP